MNRGVLAVGVILAAVLGLAAADPPKPLERADLDKKAYTVALDAAKSGTKIYNDGDQGGCLKLYEGTLMALAAVLDHRPELVTEIKDRLKEADGLTAVDTKAFALRKAIDAVMDQCGPKKPLWDRLGGDKPVAKVVDEFVIKAGADKDVDFFRGGKYPSDEKAVLKLKVSVLGLVSEATGGPIKYLGKDMKAAHADMKITGKQFDRLAAILGEVLDANKVPKAEKAELLAIVGSTRASIVQPLWDRLGGEKGVGAVVDEFLATAGADKKANIDRDGNYPLTKERAAAVRKHLIDLISSLTGGGAKYTGRDMKNIHQGMKITEDEFAAAAGHLVKALEKFKVDPADAKELLDIVASTAKDIIEVKKK